MRLKNKVIVVTGGSGLLGRNLVMKCIEEGAVALNLDVTAVSDGETTYKVDITDEQGLKECLSEIVNKYSKIDGWVNNAYPRTADWGTPFEAEPIESWRKNVDLHLNGYALCCKTVVRHMLRQGSGSIVNMGSIYGMAGPDMTVYENTGITNPAGYAAIKGGVLNLTRYLASYYGPRGIRVNSVSPGGVFDGQDRRFVENYSRKVPLRRMAAPEDIAPSVIFLLSEDARYITGHNLVVDGGWSIV